MTKFLYKNYQEQMDVVFDESWLGKPIFIKFDKFSLFSSCIGGGGVKSNNISLK